MRRYAPQSYLDSRIRQRGAAYADELAPAIVERGDGFIIVDDEHPAFIALREKYAPVPNRPPPTPEQQAAYEQAVKDSEAGKLNLFHELWRELHTMRDPTPEKLALFTARIPCGECKDHWRQLNDAEPLDMSSDEAFFAGTVAKHDEINRRLGRPPFGLPAARELYGR